VNGQALRVGELRPSQLLHTYGVGAVADLPNLSVVVSGLEDWDLANSGIVQEERLLAALRTHLGSQVQALRTAPYRPETADPFALVADRLRAALGRQPGPVGLANRMWVEHALRLEQALGGGRPALAGPVMSGLRIRKSPAEVAALRRAGQAIDRVQERIGEWLRAGRTEAEVGRDIADAIVAEGHVRADFVIVGSGPNAASPHHQVSDRVIQAGDVVVVDIGGTTAEGYCSDETRTYLVGGDPDPEFWAYYAVLQRAQEAACAAIKPGVSCESIDAAAREVIAAAGYGEYFVHRTGHGIGLEGHEDPYLVAGNTQPLEPGMTFSVEPGIYLPGRHGARIEDICACTEDGGERLNLVPRDLVVLR